MTVIIFSKLGVRRVKSYLGSVFAFLLLVISSSSYAKPEFTVALEHWPPFIFIEDKTYSGIDVDLLRELEKRLDLELKLVAYPWARTLHSLETGKIDATISITKTPEREAYLNFTSIPYYEVSPAFYVQQGHKETIQTYEDLYSLPTGVGMVKGSSYFGRFDSDSALNKVLVSKEQQLLGMLKLGRISAFVGMEAQVDYHLALDKKQNQIEKAYYRPESYIYLYLALSKKSPHSQNIEQFNQTIAEIIKDGTLEVIKAKYFN